MNKDSQQKQQLLGISWNKIQINRVTRKKIKGEKRQKKLFTIKHGGRGKALLEMPVF